MKNTLRGVNRSHYDKIGLVKILHRRFTLNNLIETKELNTLINEDKYRNRLSILDCSWFLPNDDKNAKELFKNDKIPYSKFFDIDEISDKSTDLPHMFPSLDIFVKNVKNLDIRKNDYIICYDRSGIFSSPRVWFTFKLFGAKNVAVLNGGYPKWLKDNFPIVRSPYNETINRDANKEDDFSYSFDSEKIRDLDLIIQLSSQIIGKKTKEQLIDARPTPRYNGEAPEPRPSKKLGHIPGALNVFFKNLLNEDSCFKSEEDLKREFEKQGVNLDEKITLYCGTGVTASVDLLALTLLGKYDNCKLYDGSWGEYGNVDESENMNLRKLNSLFDQIKNKKI